MDRHIEKTPHAATEEEDRHIRENPGIVHRSLLAIPFILSPGVPSWRRPDFPLSVGAGLPATRKTSNTLLTRIAGKPAPTGHDSFLPLVPKLQLGNALPGKLQLPFCYS
jgi:hypothetical protein